MSKTLSFIVKRWRLLLNIVTVVALIFLIYFIRHDLATTFRNLLHVNGWAIFLMVPIEMFNYHYQARLYQMLFRIVGNKLDYRYLFRASLELAFVNHVFPSGGVAGISYFSLRLRDEDISGAKASMVQFMKLLLTIFSFEILVFISIFFLAIGGKVNSFTILVASILSTLLLVGSAMFIYIIGNRHRIGAFLEYVTVKLNRLISLIPSTKKEAIDITKARMVFDDFHETFSEMRKDKRKMRKPLLYALMLNITEISVIYVVFIAFGHFINPGAVILAYGVANFSGFISVLPGGVGIYEALMIAVLFTAGVSTDLSLPVIIMYRVLNTLIQLPPGYYFYQKYISQHGKPPKTREYYGRSS
jgi:uncharacterized protein (TIRG00374 family)